MGTTHTYGALGLSTIVLIAGLLASGCHRTGSFLVGLAPALHPSLGTWFVIAVGLTLVWSGKEFRNQTWPMLPYFLIGSGITTVSFIAQFALMMDVPAVERALADKYVTAFVGFWDGHRQPVNLASPGVQLNAGALVLASIWLAWFARDLAHQSLVLLRLIATVAALSLVVALLSHVPAQSLPGALVISMPGRLLNFSAMIFPALLLGLIGAYCRRWWSRWLLLFLTIGLALNNRSMLWDWLAKDGWARDLLHVTRPMQMFTYAAALLLLGVGASAWRAQRGNLTREAAAPDLLATASTVARVVLIMLLVTIAGWTWRLSADRTVFLDWRNNAVLTLASQGEGLLLTGGDLHLVQLRTRRPVLLDGGGLDGLPYAPEGAPATERILSEVYGIDFFNPPEAARGTGTIPNTFNRLIWESYSLDRWQHIRREYGVTRVLTYADWNLQLPVIARDRALALFQLPATP
jgi:hypothetical protein